MLRYKMHFMLLVLASVVFDGRIANGAIANNSNPDKDAVVVLTHYTKDWDYYEIGATFEHIATHIQWSSDKPGSYDWDDCLLYQDEVLISYYGWLNLIWNEHGDGLGYGTGILGRGDCGARDYSYSSPITGFRPPMPNRICHGGSYRVGTDQNGFLVEETVNRQEKITYELHTGTKGYPSQNLFIINASATAHSDLFYPEVDGYTGSYAVSPTAIQVGDLGVLSGDGVLCVALPNNSTRDVTLHTPSRYYDCGINAGKYLFSSQVLCIPPGDTKTDRTTLGVGEIVLLSFDPAPPLPVLWTATAGTLGGSGSAVFFTARAVAGNATVAATVHGARLSVDFDVLEPTGYDHADITSPSSFPIGVAGAGMHLNVYLAPTTVSFNQVQIFEVGQPASDITGYFLQTGHAPTSHGDSQGANVWQPVGCGNLIGNGFDNAFYSGSTLLPAPWTEGGGFTWHVPVLWKVGNGASHSLTSWDQVFSLQTNGTFTVSKFGHSTTRSIDNVSSTQ